jgi:hypothetical protein
MLQHGQVLLSDADFDNAMFFGVDVIVWQHGEIIDYGGKITKHTNVSVYIGEGYFIKKNCLIKTR